MTDKEIEELRSVLSTIEKEKADLANAERDKAHADLRIDQGSQRLKAAVDKYDALMDAQNDTLAVMGRLCKHAEQWGRTHQ